MSCLQATFHLSKLFFILMKLCYLFLAYKCLGHTYEIGNSLVHSYYLVIEKNLTVPKIGDVVVSNVSGGFIETVVAVHKTNDTGYLETKFQRCNENSQLNVTRYSKDKIPLFRNKCYEYKYSGDYINSRALIGREWRHTALISPSTNF